jgi:enterochelin esterase family protein
MAGSTTGSQTIEEFLTELTSRPEHERSYVVDRFMSSCPSIPGFTGEERAHFLFRGHAGSVTIPSDANGWNPAGSPMVRIEGTDLWHHTSTFESNARIDYKFLIDGMHWILDPLNPLRVEGSYGWNSELRMPRYKSPREIEFYENMSHGSVVAAEIRSEILSNTRSIRIYTPPGYHRTDEKFPVVLFHDGLEFLSMGCVNNILDYLIARRRMAPVIAVCVPPVNRNAEYSGPQMGSFYSFIIEELLPYIDSHFRTRRCPSDRASIGASNGGNISLWLGLSYPEVFGNIAALSSNVVSAVFEGYEESPRLDLRFYLDAGTYDQPDLIPRIREFTELIKAKGYPFQFRKYHEGHSWGNWRAHVGRALTMFFPPPASAVPLRPWSSRKPGVQNSAPDALTPTDTISFVVPEAGRFTLKVFDLAGRDVRTLFDGTLTPGEHRVQRGLEGLSAGLYSYILSGENFNLSRKFRLVPRPVENLFSEQDSGLARIPGSDVPILK